MDDAMHGAVPEGWSYSGEAWTGADGRATVLLPTFARSHRFGFDYELTPVDSEVRATLETSAEAERFTIVTDRPNVKVAWKATPLRLPGQVQP
jgi:hypothetical protein